MLQTKYLKREIYKQGNFIVKRRVYIFFQQFFRPNKCPDEFAADQTNPNQKDEQLQEFEILYSVHPPHQDPSAGS